MFNLPKFSHFFFFFLTGSSMLYFDLVCLCYFLKLHKVERAPLFLKFIFKPFPKMRGI